MNKAIILLSEYLGIDLKQHCAYHPQSGGAVERENGIFKNKLTKCCADTRLSWTKAHPLVFTQMRANIRSRNHLSPFEIPLGRPINTGAGPAKRQLPGTEECTDGMLRYSVNLFSALSAVHTQVVHAYPRQPTQPQTRGLGGDKGLQEKMVEPGQLARTVPSSLYHRFSSKDCREGRVGAHQPLQTGAATRDPRPKERVPLCSHTRKRNRRR